MQRFLVVSALLTLSAAAFPLHAQNSTTSASSAAQPSSNQVSADYPKNRAGVLIGETTWAELANQTPSKTKVAHGIAASLSYGLAPAKLVAEYAGDHAATRAADAQPILCICHFSGLPGTPVLVRLHVKKDVRELDGGRMTVYPIVGGAKSADANKTDLVDVSQPEPQVWLIRPATPLDPGEYALMLGTQNMNIFPFEIAAPPPPATK
jgi:hypothetical protein